MAGDRGVRMMLPERLDPVVVIIPARGGSKGVPRKNLRDVAGRPLLAWSLLDSFESRRATAVYVSTEDVEIRAVALAYGAKVIERPAELAGDAISSEAVLEHALAAITRATSEPGLIVFLQATSPIRSGADIDAAVSLLETAGADSLLSVSPSHAFLWEERNSLGVAVNYDTNLRPRRQDMPAQYRENGSIYVFKPWVLRRHHNRLGGRTVLFKMPEAAGIDIDSELDLALADWQLRRGTGVRE